MTERRVQRRRLLLATLLLIGLTTILGGSWLAADLADRPADAELQDWIVLIASTIVLLVSGVFLFLPRLRRTLLVAHVTWLVILDIFALVISFGIALGAVGGSGP